ncbi:MAG: hypothetical protein LBB65_01140 [Burkholderiales bacterium]|jgi:hypothetical protein|nr:hypothetical protein [Burkholderiales bacterium]
MHYWNQDNFEGLLKLAQVFEGDVELKLLASYCRLREQGLRRNAFAKLEEFLTATSSFDNATARRVTIKILESNARTQRAHQFITQPLVTLFLEPTLQIWMQEDANANLPVRWLGILRHDSDLLNQALAMCPTDLPVRISLINFVLGDVDYATHHLDESLFIGCVDEALGDLADARRFIAESPDQAALAYLAAEVEHFDQMIVDWQSWSTHREGTFRGWCAKQGRNYHYPIKAYYKHDG